jgi:hypothetical protein
MAIAMSPPRVNSKCTGLGDQAQVTHLACVQTPQLNNKHYYAQFDGLGRVSGVTEVWMHGGSAAIQVRRKHGQAAEKIAADC